MKKSFFLLVLFTALGVGVFADTFYYVYADDWDSKKVVISEVYEPSTGINNLASQFHDWCEANIEDLTHVAYFNFKHSYISDATSRSDLERYKQSQIAKYKNNGFTVYDLERRQSVPPFRFSDEY